MRDRYNVAAALTPLRNRCCTKRSIMSMVCPWIRAPDMAQQLSRRAELSVREMEAAGELGRVAAK